MKQVCEQIFINLVTRLWFVNKTHQRVKRVSVTSDR